MSASTQSLNPSRAVHRLPEQRLLSYLPRGNLLDDEAWLHRHRVVTWVLAVHLPALAAFGLLTHHRWSSVGEALAPILLCLAMSRLTLRRRMRSFFVTAGIVYCSVALVGLSRGSIEAHFHFFIIIGFIALYQDWVPFLWNIVFTVLSHGIGSAFQSNLIFNHAAAIDHPWLWSLIHGAAVLLACVGMVLFWRTSEDEQQKSIRLTRELGAAEVAQFTSELLVNLARRNQSMLYRQLDILNELEEQERDPDALAGLFRVDHLSTRIRRNAENLLVLSGEEPPRVWHTPVLLGDVVRAAIAETEDLNRISPLIDERLAVHGRVVADLTHLLAELIENAARFSPPDSKVVVRSTPDVRSPGTWVITVEDRGVGLHGDDLLTANEVLARPRGRDVVKSQRLGLHVVARLAERHGIQVSLAATSMVGITAVVQLPTDLFSLAASEPDAPSYQVEVLQALTAGAEPPPAPRRTGATTAAAGRGSWNGWWQKRPLITSRGTAPAINRVPVVAAALQVADDDPVENPVEDAVEHEVEDAVEHEVEDAVPARVIQIHTVDDLADGLPHRTPQASLAPQLRHGQPPRAVAAVGPDAAAQARAALSRFQSGRQQALKEPTPPGVRRG